jgi:hypothetical protein
MMRGARLALHGPAWRECASEEALIPVRPFTCCTDGPPRCERECEHCCMICLNNASRRRRTALNGAAHINASHGHKSPHPSIWHYCVAWAMSLVDGRWGHVYAAGWRCLLTYLLTDGVEEGAGSVASVKRPPIRRCSHQAREIPPYRNSNRDSTNKAPSLHHRHTEVLKSDRPEDFLAGPKQVSVGLPRRRWQSGTTGVLARRRVHA